MIISARRKSRLLRQMQADAMARQQAEAQQAYYQAQTELARAQKQALHLQQWVANQPSGTPQVPTKPKSAPLTETKAFLHKVQGLRGMAQQLKNMKKLDDVDIMSALIDRAAKLSDNNRTEFMFLMNEILFGTNQNIPVLDDRGITPNRHGKRFHIGDQGMNSLYQDGEDVQMSHFWGYVNYGYFVPKDIVKVADFIHAKRNHL